MSSICAPFDQAVMSTDMPLLWVQYWTALPVLVEDGEMNDGSHLGGRLPPGTYPVDPSTHYRIDEDPNPSPNGMSTY